MRDATGIATEASDGRAIRAGTKGYLLRAVTSEETLQEVYVSAVGPNRLLGGKKGDLLVDKTRGHVLPGAILLPELLPT